VTARGIASERSIAMVRFSCHIPGSQKVKYLTLPSFFARCASYWGGPGTAPGPPIFMPRNALVAARLRSPGRRRRPSNVPSSSMREMYYCTQQARHDQRPAPTRLGAQGCFELISGPLDYVVELLAALGELRHNHGIDRLIAISRTDFAWAGDRDLLVAHGGYRTCSNDHRSRYTHASS
jgi:hypothetical protein